jgi:alpha-beta hydrolase superfamily lysophospholipase
MTAPALAQHLTVRAVDGTALAVGAYPGAAGGPVALIVHGIASHMGWYRGLSAALQAEGVTVYMSDRRGVALSQGTPGHTGHWKTLVQDLRTVAEEVEARHRGQTMHAIGISLGGVITLACSIVHPGLFASQILLSPALVASVRFPLMRRLEVFWRAVSSPSRLYDLPFGIKELTDNPDWQKALLEEATQSQVSARFLLETLRIQRYVRKHIGCIDVPILALFGDRDLVIDNQASIAILGKAGSSLVRVEVFETISHILAASLPKRELATRLLSWLREERGSAKQRLTILKTLLVKRDDDVFFSPLLGKTEP